MTFKIFPFSCPNSVIIVNKKGLKSSLRARRVKLVRTRGIQYVFGEERYRTWQMIQKKTGKYNGFVERH